MLYEIVTESLQKYLYIVHNERYGNELGTGKMERIIGKHPSLKPKLIVQDDQILGFKAIGKKERSLEAFPIFAELDYEEVEDGLYLNTADLYCETSQNVTTNLRQILKLGKMYGQTVYLERIRRLDDPTEESLIIYSKLSELISDESFEEDLAEGFITEQEVRDIIEEKVSGFVSFITLLDAVLLKNIPISQIDAVFKTIPQSNA
jgi:hypothetical protein